MADKKTCFVCKKESSEEDLNNKQLNLKNQYRRTRAKEQFKAIMIFIDKKGYMPIGEENE